MSDLAVLILAAGRGLRMRGADKLLQRVEGRPVLRHLALQALGLDLPVFVTLPRGATGRRAALDGLDVSIVDVANPEVGMSVSLGAGIAALPTGSSGVMLVLGDMPEVTGRDMADLVAAFDAAGGDVVIRACDADGTPGHPVVFPARLFGALAGLTGDRGAKQILRDEDVRLVSLPGRHATLDLDTPEEWAEWSASQSTEK